MAVRLGYDASDALVALLDSTREEWTQHVVTLTVDRFEDRLTSEVSLLRVDFTRDVAALRQDMTQGLTAIRQDFTRDLSAVRVELLKWSFLFWVGQVAAMAGLLAFMLRTP